jgi:starvation-inducible DNA-binding protein
METELIQQLNRTLSNIQVLYIKLHNYHWNVKGPNFFNIHNLTEEYYNYFGEQFDEVAERILQLQAKPLTTLQEYTGNATLKEESRKDFSHGEVIQNLIADFRVVHQDFQKLSTLASENEDSTTAALADENLQWLEKALWMLQASQS